MIRTGAGAIVTLWEQNKVQIFQNKFIRTLLNASRFLNASVKCHGGREAEIT